MGLFDFLKKEKVKLTDEQQKWNTMWEMWSEGKINSPYEELMTYQSEINNGGHDQYFVNVENNSDIQKEMSALKTILSEELTDNLEKAYQAYLLLGFRNSILKEKWRFYATVQKYRNSANDYEKSITKNYVISIH